jgi:hypothetical protein
MTTSAHTRIAATVGVFLASMSLLAMVGCGESASDPAVKIGQTRIQAATVEHWENAPRLGPAEATGPSNTRRDRALDFLISGYWLIGEATRQRLTVTPTAVKLRVEAALGSLGDAAKVASKLAAIGRTLADVEFEARVALSAVALSEWIAGQVESPTQSKMVTYYWTHSGQFRRERRVVDIIERIPSKAAAVALARSLGSGRRFAKRGFHEILQRPTRAEVLHNRTGNVVHAVFVAPLHKIIGPIRYLSHWAVFIVRRVLRGPLPFVEVESKIAGHFVAVGEPPVRDAFLSEYRSEWRAATKCQPDFIVPECSESHAGAISEANSIPRAAEAGTGR